MVGKQNIEGVEILDGGDITYTMWGDTEHKYSFLIANQSSLFLGHYRSTNVRLFGVGYNHTYLRIWFKDEINFFII